MSETKGLDSLQVWQRSMDFTKKVHVRVLPALPKEEKWAMASQLRRAVQSVPANIAEGYGRFYYQEGVRFCYIARGSLEETYTFLTLAIELGYLNPGVYAELAAELQEIKRMLNGYIAFLKRTKRGAAEPGAIREPLPDYFAQSDLEAPDYLSDEATE